MSVTVIVTDNQTGDTDTVIVGDGDYLLTCVEPCWLDSTQVYATSGTHLLTIKGHKPRKAS